MTHLEKAAHARTACAGHNLLAWARRRPDGIPPEADLHKGIYLMAEFVMEADSIKTASRGALRDRMRTRKNRTQVPSGLAQAPLGLNGNGEQDAAVEG